MLLHFIKYSKYFSLDNMPWSGLIQQILEQHETDLWSINIISLCIQANRICDPHFIKRKSRYLSTNNPSKYSSKHYRKYSLIVCLLIYFKNRQQTSLNIFDPFFFLVNAYMHKICSISHLRIKNVLLMSNNWYILQHVWGYIKQYFIFRHQAFNIFMIDRYSTHPIFQIFRGSYYDCYTWLYT